MIGISEKKTKNKTVRAKMKTLQKFLIIYSRIFASSTLGVIPV